MLSEDTAVFQQNLLNYLLTGMAVMDSQREGESAGATVLSLWVQWRVHCWVESLEGDHVCTVVLTFRVMDSLGIRGCYFVCFTLISEKEKEGEMDAVSEG